MTSTIKVNNVQNQCGANIINENSNTITIGASGDTIALASGASQTGFGREGTVDWQTSSIKTSTFTAVSGQGFFCDTNSGGFTCNLPAGSAGAIVSLQDYRNTFDTAALVVSPNGSEKINGGAGAVTLSTEGEGITLVYIDSTVGWRSIQDNDFATVGSNYVAATGGTVTTVCTDYKVHTFTGPGSFIVSAGGSPAGSNTVDYLVIAGGGGGAGNPGAGSGGGAGGYRESVPSPAAWTGSPLANPANARPVSAQTYPITVGGGGTVSQPQGNEGGNSIFSDITSAGGGGGGGSGSSAGKPGGSGGGSAGTPEPGSTFAGGSGNTPPVSPPQGNNGGGAPGPSTARGGAGGGGAGGTGSNASNPGGSGGSGVPNDIRGPSTTYSSGAAGAPGPSPHPGPSGSANTGNAGEGGKGGGVPSGSGGSGRVVIRGPSAVTFAVSPGTNSTSTHPGGDKIADFTVSGTLTVS